jgi:hypothetical protein
MTESEQLDELLLHWEEIRQQGGDPTVEQLCCDCPHLASPLQQRILAMQKMETLLEVSSHSCDDNSISNRLASNGVVEPANNDETLPVISGYEVLSILGRGGMGVVYRARQEKLGRMVAVKMLDSAHTGTRHLERFFDEAQAVAGLKHSLLAPPCLCGKCFTTTLHHRRVFARGYREMSRQFVLSALRRKFAIVTDRRKIWRTTCNDSQNTNQSRHVELVLRVGRRSG